MTTKLLTAGSAVPHLKAVAAGTQYPNKKKLQPGKAYRVRQPQHRSPVTTKMKRMTATCQACSGN